LDKWVIFAVLLLLTLINSRKENNHEYRFEIDDQGSSDEVFKPTAQNLFGCTEKIHDTPTQGKQRTTPIFETITFTLIWTPGDNIKTTIAIFINIE
jgi:hypothetical protein